MNLESLLGRYKKTGILPDTNILLLYFVGLYNERHIETFKRTSKFGIEDYHLLKSFLSHFDKIITTPNILTEVSNLLSQLAENLIQKQFEVFSHKITIFNETYLPSSNLAGKDEFRKFGLTDTGILYVSSNQYLVLTDDFKLSNYFQKKGLDIINFNHLRGYYWI